MRKNFNQDKYINEFKKKYYKQFKVELFKEESEKLDTLLKEKQLSKADFVRIAKSSLADGTLKMKYCDDIVRYLQKKKLRTDFMSEEQCGHYINPEQTTINLKDGTLSYRISKEEHECYIIISKEKDSNNTNDIFYDGYFTADILEKLLDLIA